MPPSKPIALLTESSRYLDPPDFPRSLFDCVAFPAPVKLMRTTVLVDALFVVVAKVSHKLGKNKPRVKKDGMQPDDPARRIRVTRIDTLLSGEACYVLTRLPRVVMEEVEKTTQPPVIVPGPMEPDELSEAQAHLAICNAREELRRREKEGAP